MKDWILNNMTIVCDTREKENWHITGAINQLGGRWSIETLKTADYAYRIGGELCTDLLIERKNSLDELAANVTGGRERFERELQRAADTQARLILLVERGDYDGLFEKNYRVKVSDKAFQATLFTYQERYGLETVFIAPQHTGRYIYNRFFYHVREQIRKRDSGIG
jgi:hypothetical protein